MTSLAKTPAGIAVGIFKLRQALVLLALLILVASTEGIGLMLLMPLLAVLARDSSVASDFPLGTVGTLPITLGLGPLLAVLVALVGLRAVVQWARAGASVKFERHVVETLRARALAALLKANWRTVCRLRPGEGLAVLTTGINHLGSGVQELVAASAAILLLASAVVAVLVLSPELGLVAVAGAVIAAASYGAVRRRISSLGEELSETHLHLTGRLAETTAAVRLIKSFGAEQRTCEDIAQVDATLTSNRMRYQRLTWSALGVFHFASATLIAAAVWLSVTQFGVSPLVLIPLIAVFARMLPILAALQQHWHAWRNSLPALEAALRFIRELEAAAEPAVAAAHLPCPARTISLRQVTVQYPDRDAAALHQITVDLAVNSTTTLVGPSGAGKSTLADVLGGLVAPDTGELVLDGHSLLPQERIAWRAQVAYVQQDPVLFNASVRDNLLWASPAASSSDLEGALRDAAAEFVLDLPQGLNTVVGDRGWRMSGGERQRIALARALLRQPSLFIFDEPTSALDPRSEAAVADAVQRLRGRFTILIIGHRGLLAALADRKIRLEAGRLVEPAAGRSRRTASNHV